MSRCVYCDQSFQPAFGWQELILYMPEKLLCQRCEVQLIRLDKDLCTLCGRSLSALNPAYHNGEHCLDCQKWEKDDQFTGVLKKSRSVYVYNDFLKEVITLFKFRGDYQIIEAFHYEIQQLFKKEFQKDVIIVPIPLSNERHYERGFNQAEAMAISIKKPYERLLVRKHTEKQSKKGRIERIKNHTIFQVADKQKINSANVLLVDDIYTTGATLRAAAKQCISSGAASVSALTLARS